MSAVRDALASPELRLGVAFGVVSATLLLSRRVRPQAPALLALACAGAVGLWGAGVPAVALLVVAAGAWRGWYPLALAGVVVLGATVDPLTAGALLVGAATLGAQGVVDVSAAPRVITILLIMSALGVWAGVPDTEEVLVVGGVLVPPLLVLAWRAGPLTLSWASGAALASPIVWCAVEGGRARPGAVIGGVACLGVLLTEPVRRRVQPARMSSALVVIHGAVVLVAARVAAHREGVVAASLIAAATLSLAMVISAWRAPRRDPRTPEG